MRPAGEPKKIKIALGISSLALWVTLGCSTTRVAPPPPPLPPSYTNVPHPAGTDMGDLTEIFRAETAPQDGEFIKTCDQDFNKLLSSTQSEKEINEGTRELLRRDPVRYHWCFYGKLRALETEMQKDTYLDERQKVALDTFEFLVPIAKGFAKEFHDSRYLRWATHKYKKLSEWIFYRKLDLTPAGTEELVEVANPFGLWRDTFGGSPILEKYHLVESLPQTDLPATLPPGEFQASAIAPAPGTGPATAPVVVATAPIAGSTPALSSAQFGDDIPDSATIEPIREPQSTPISAPVATQVTAPSPPPPLPPPSSLPPKVEALKPAATSLVQNKPVAEVVAKAEPSPQKGTLSADPDTDIPAASEVTAAPIAVATPKPVVTPVPVKPIVKAPPTPKPVAPPVPVKPIAKAPVPVPPPKPVVVAKPTLSSDPDTDIPPSSPQLKLTPQKPTPAPKLVSKPVTSSSVAKASAPVKKPTIPSDDTDIPLN